MKNNPIGIYDSGVGGLTILDELKKNFPNESFIYFADSARAPFGDKSKEELLEINNEIINFLLNKKIKMIVMACNTSCSLFLEKLQEDYSIPFVGLISQAVENAVNISLNKKIAVLGTTRTISSHIYKSAILEINNECQVLEIACPELVPLVESNAIFTASGFNITKSYFQNVLDFGADTLIYGCSHYPYLEPIFRKFCTKPIKFVDPAKTQTIEVQKKLIESKITAPANHNSETLFWTSGDTGKLAHFINRYYKWDNIDIHSYDKSPESN